MMRQPIGLVIEAVVWWGLCLGVWLVTLSAVSGQELVVATPLGLVSGVLAVIARRVAGNRWRLRPQWFLPVLLVPVAILADTVRVLAAAVTRPSGRFVDLPVSQGAGDGAPARGRRALATMVITVSPGTIVVDIDPETGRATVHTLNAGRPHMEEVVAR